MHAASRPYKTHTYTPSNGHFPCEPALVDCPRITQRHSGKVANSAAVIATEHT